MENALWNAEKAEKKGDIEKVDYYLKKAIEFEDSPSDVIAEAVMGDVLLFRLKNEDIRNLMNKIPEIKRSLIKELNSKIANLRKIIVTIG